MSDVTGSHLGHCNHEESSLKSLMTGGIVQPNVHPEQEESKLLRELISEVPKKML